MIRLSAGTTNAYLLEARQGWLLVDTGYERDEQRFLRALRRHHIRVEDIAFVLLTHHHDDHAGLTARLTAMNPMIRVVVHERSLPLLETGQNDLSHGGYWLNHRVRFLAKLKKLVTPAWDLRFPPYRLRQGDIVVTGGCNESALRSLGLPATLLATPGHSVDSISVLLDSGEALVGDAAAAFLGFAGTHHCVVFITDLDEYYASWRRLIDARVETVHPAHGRPFPIALLERDLHRNSSQDLVPFTGL